MSKHNDKHQDQQAEDLPFESVDLMEDLEPFDVQLDQVDDESVKSMYFFPNDGDNAFSVEAASAEEAEEANKHYLEDLKKENT